MDKKRMKYTGFFGFAGFLGFQYFISGEVRSLFWFSFFAFFSYFILGRLAEEMPDERYLANSQRAKAVSAGVPLTTVFIVGFCAGSSWMTREAVTVVCALGWSLTLIAYALLFWHYERS